MGVCDGCDAEDVEVFDYVGDLLCETCCDEAADEDGLDDLMRGDLKFEYEKYVEEQQHSNLMYVSFDEWV
tara:strand:- start:430 stop:639 length:210 start_codon:yes stop_codon:yes gene_type:complete